MLAAIKYSDDEIKDYHHLESVESYLNLLRQEVRQNANGRTYEFWIRDKGETLALFKDGKLRRKQNYR